MTCRCHPQAGDRKTMRRKSSEYCQPDRRPTRRTQLRDWNRGETSARGPGDPSRRHPDRGRRVAPRRHAPPAGAGRLPGTHADSRPRHPRRRPGIHGPRRGSGSGGAAGRLSRTPTSRARSVSAAGAAETEVRACWWGGSPRPAGCNHHDVRRRVRWSGLPHRTESRRPARYGSTCYRSCCGSS